MCNNLDRSALKIFEIIAKGPITGKELYRTVGLQPLSVRLAYTRTFKEFVRALLFDGNIEETNSGYKLTSSGKAELRKLKQRCAV